MTGEVSDLGWLLFLASFVLIAVVSAALALKFGLEGRRTASRRAGGLALVSLILLGLVVLAALIALGPVGPAN